MHKQMKTLKETLARHRKGEADIEHLYTAIEDLPDMDSLVVIVVGNPLDGITIEGPYEDEDTALENYSSGCGSDWWVALLHEPED